MCSSVTGAWSITRGLADSLAVFPAVLDAQEGEGVSEIIMRKLRLPYTRCNCCSSWIVTSTVNLSSFPSGEFPIFSPCPLLSLYHHHPVLTSSGGISGNWCWWISLLCWPLSQNKMLPVQNQVLPTHESASIGKELCASRKVLKVPRYLPGVLVNASHDRGLCFTAMSYAQLHAGFVHVEHLFLPVLCGLVPPSDTYAQISLWYLPSVHATPLLS